MRTPVIKFQGTVKAFKRALRNSRKLAMKTGGGLSDPAVAKQARQLFETAERCEATRLILAGGRWR